MEGSVVMSLMRLAAAILALAKFGAEALASPMVTALCRTIPTTLQIEKSCQRSLLQQGVIFCPCVINYKLRFVVLKYKYH